MKNELYVLDFHGKSLPVVALTGPRQCGKTTLARELLDPAASTYFDLQDQRTVR